MTSWAGNYQTGRPYAQCDRCDRKMRRDELKEEWSGLLVCRRCWDPRPEHLTAPRIDPNEGAPLPNARPAVIETASEEQLAFAYRDGTVFDPAWPTDVGPLPGEVVAARQDAAATVETEMLFSDGSVVCWSDGQAALWSD